MVTAQILLENTSTKDEEYLTQAFKSTATRPPTLKRTYSSGNRDQQFLFVEIRSQTRFPSTQGF